MRRERERERDLSFSLETGSCRFQREFEPDYCEYSLPRLFAQKITTAAVLMEISTARLPHHQVLQLLWKSRTLNRIPVVTFPQVVATCNRAFHSRPSFLKSLHEHHIAGRAFPESASIEELPLFHSDDDGDADLIDEENPSEDEDPLNRPLTSEELKALLADSEREKLTGKLSEANQQNRFLKRQLFTKEDALVNFKSELAVMELEVQALVALAEEIVKVGIPEGSRKINGKYIQSHLLSRLEAINEKLKDQIKDVGAAQSKEVPLFWIGMAESVQVMGTFDGWSQGEHLSPEYTGSYTKFSTTLMLRPGRYEIKFLVDGEWQLSPEFPIVGEGMMENNLLIVE